MIEIPLNSSPEQLFTSTLSGQVFNIRVILNSRLGVWSINFSKDGVDIINGVNIVGGIDLLRAHNLPISNLYVVNLDTNDDPTRDNLGSIAKLVILEDSELDG